MKHAAFCVFLFLCAGASANAQNEYGRSERSDMKRLFDVVHAEQQAREGMTTAYRVIMRACKNQDVSLEKRAWVAEHPHEARRDMMIALRTCKDHKAASGAVVTREQLELVVRLAFNEFLLVQERAASYSNSFQAR